MLLTKVKVRNYLSINGECDLPVDPRVSVLLGANDHGKSNLLRSLEHLNFDRPILREDVNWDSAGPRIDFVFRLTDPELAIINQLSTSLTAELAEARAAEEALLVREQEIGEAPDLLPPEPATAPTPAIAGTTVAAVKPVATTSSEPALDEEDGFPFRDQQEIESDIAFVQAVLTGAREITLSRDGVDSPLCLHGRSVQGLKDEIEIAFAEMIPRVELFKAFSGELQDSVTADEIKDDDSEFLQGIFFYAGLDPLNSEDLFVQDDETDKTLEAASRQLDAALRERWAQGVDLDLHFQLKHRGSSIELLVEDPAVKRRKARMSKRSAGVTQFFRLSLVLHARRKKNPSNSYIYVFDEPGVFLHPKGQKDLLAVFEQLAEDTQIIYATHSLFMLNQNFPERHRLITKSQNSTAVDAKPYRANWKYAVDDLGVRLTANILFSPNILLVEGDSDPIYLYEMLRLLNQADEIDADANLLGIMSYSDLPNLRFLLQTFKAESSDRLLAVLFDGDSQGKAYQKDIASLTKRVEAKHIVLESGSAIEDYCLNTSLFLQAVQDTLISSYEAIDKKVPTDLRATISSSWEDFQKNRSKATTKEKKPTEALMEKGSSVPLPVNAEVSSDNAGVWFKTLSIRLIDNGSSKVALARNYAFLSREHGTLQGVDAKRIQQARVLAQQIISALHLPSRRAKKEIEV